MEKVKKDFPIFNNRQIIYLDSAATSQKPQVVINTIKKFYENSNANVHRGLNSIAEESTNLYEGARKIIANFINAETKETIFVRNATEGINLVAHSYVKPNLRKGDMILLTEMEHHANIVPWQIIAKEKEAIIKYIPFDKNGNLDLSIAKKLLSQKPKFFSVVHISNVLGTINPIEKLIKLAHSYGVPVLIDAAQSITHKKINVKKLNPEFLVFSSHKMFGPSGIGILYGKKHLLEQMPPFLGGGDMIRSVSFNHFRPNELPFKFEAGTPNIEGAIGLASAIKYIENLNQKNIEKYLKNLTKYAYKRLSKVEGIKIYGPKNRANLISFNLGDIHSHDLTSILDEDKIAIRSGHHCAQPLIDKLNVASVARASFQIYNTKEDIDLLVKSLERARRVFRL